MLNNEELSEKELLLLDKLKKIAEDFQEIYYEEKEIVIEDKKSKQ